MNEVTQARLKGELLKEIRGAIWRDVYNGLLKQALDDFNAAYLRSNAHEASPAEEEAFLSKSYTVSSAQREAEAIINELTDALIEVVGKYIQPKRWRTLWKIIGVAAILPSIHSLLSYAWAGCQATDTFDPLAT